MATSRIADQKAGRPNRVRQRDRRHEDGRGDCRKKQHSLRRIGGRQLAGEEQIEAVAEHRTDREEDGWLDALRPGAGDDDHADEADRDRRPAPGSDPLAEQRAGETGDDEGAGKGDGRGLGELQVAERQKVEDCRQGEEQAPHQLQERAPRQIERPFPPRAERQQARRSWRRHSGRKRPPSPAPTGWHISPRHRGRRTSGAPGNRGRPPAAER